MTDLPGSIVLEDALDFMESEDFRSWVDPMLAPRDVVRESTP